MKNVLQYLVFLGLAAGLTWYAIHSGTINPEQLWADVSQADFRWVGVMMLLTFVAHGSRAARWRILLEPLGYHPSFLRTNTAVWLGYFANNLVPRLGEVTRCSALYKSDEIPIEKSLGTVVTERIFDVLSLFILLGINLLLDFDRLLAFIQRSTSATPDSESGVPVLIWIVLGLLIAGGLTVFFLWERLLELAIVKKLAKAGQGLLAGLLSIRKLRQPGLFLFYTVMIWGMYYVMGYVLFFAIPKFADLSPLVALTIMTTGALAMILPTPGGVGSYNAFVAFALHSIYELPEADSGTLATFIQSSQMLSTLAIGLVFLVISVISRPSRKAVVSQS
ncbi:TIGR00374 family protein [Siphonobacter sp. BAB-5405]|uniref:lysylphosphatidylglycerol synthase transmembrane domain-containing protein n=1 Tax=Siphonobacter sp. BAB-5405 TaxID=1864825 RepID=UPI000C7FEE37|nr:lysylphosphatidylglycerol synthase transmembrane domain-containing protein [Siphonobacter sp. BAB-5405]PMD98096.1 TIGR00374 family protein [Siphonobacter sp. BAB-5405]